MSVLNISFPSTLVVSCRVITPLSVYLSLHCSLPYDVELGLYFYCWADISPPDSNNLILVLSVGVQRASEHPAATMMGAQEMANPAKDVAHFIKKASRQHVGQQGIAAGVNKVGMTWHIWVCEIQVSMLIVLTQEMSLHNPTRWSFSLFPTLMSMSR